MKYVSIDIETTGRNPKTCQILELGMVLEDTESLLPLDELPRCRMLFKHEITQGEYYALNMHHESGLLREIEAFGRPPSISRAGAMNWLIDQGYTGGRHRRAFAAGKNVGSFDFQFLTEPLRSYFHHRTIDPGSVFMDWEQGPRSLGDLLGRPVAHTAIEDALAVIEVLRRSYEPEAK